MSRLFTEHLSVAYGDQTVVNDLNLRIPDGKITALIGANGSGKSTILKAMARLIKSERGSVFLDGKQMSRIQTKDIAKHLAVLPQNPVAPEGLTVKELVSFGRFPYQKGLGRLTAEDNRMIEWAMEVTALSELADRPIEHMSGGQRQRAWIAMALAQGTQMMFLDEPTTYLDMAHQIEVLKVLERLNQEEGRTIVMVVHDLNHASQYAQHIVAIKEGKVVKQGDPNEVITCSMLHEVFGIDADVIACPRTGVPICLPFGLAKDGCFRTKDPAVQGSPCNQPLQARIG